MRRGPAMTEEALDAALSAGGARAAFADATVICMGRGTARRPVEPPAPAPGFGARVHYDPVLDE